MGHTSYRKQAKFENLSQCKEELKENERSFNEKEIASFC